MRILVTGANGFLGSHIIERSLQEGHETFAAVRPHADLTHLAEIQGYQLITLDYHKPEKIPSSLSEVGPFDLIIHNAGLTKSFSLERYIQVNEGLTSSFIEWVKTSGALKKEGKFVYISSMAARGPVGNNGPASYYGESKLKAEVAVKGAGLTYLIFRPSGIYGARDNQFLPLIKAVNQGVYPMMTSKGHNMTLINARDVAGNILEVSSLFKNKTVHLDDGHVYHHADLKSTLEKLTRKKTVSLRLPGSVVLFALFFSDLIDRVFKRTPAVSVEQYKEISQDWNFDFSEERKNIPLKIEYSLYDGFKDALAYYRKKKLI